VPAAFTSSAPRGLASSLLQDAETTADEAGAVADDTDDDPDGPIQFAAAVGALRGESPVDPGNEPAIQAEPPAQPASAPAAEEEGPDPLIIVRPVFVDHDPDEVR
jgi:hypothetical protein